MNFLILAVRNLRQNVLRSLAIFLVIFILSGILMSISLLHGALTQSVELSRKRLGADVMVVPSAYSGQAQEVFLLGSTGSFTMKDAAAFQRTVLDLGQSVEAASPQLFVVSAPLACCSVSDTMIIGYDPKTDFVVTPWIKEGKDAGKVQGPDEAIVGADINAGVGGRLKFYGREVMIIGKLERTGMRYLDSGIFMPMEGVRKMVAESESKALKTLAIGPDEISCLLIKLKTDMKPEIVALLLEHDHPDKKALITSAMVRKTVNTLAIPLRGMVFQYALQWAASLVLIGVVLKFSVDERRTEFGIMKALGATDTNIYSMLAIEVMVLSGTAGVSGILAGLLLARTFARYAVLTMKIPLMLPDGLTVFMIATGVFAVSLCSGVLPALAGAWRSAKIEPFYLIKGEPGGKGMRS